MFQRGLQSEGKEQLPLETATRTVSLQTSRQRYGQLQSSSCLHSQTADIHRSPHRETHPAAGGQGRSQRVLLGNGRPVLPGGVTSIDVSLFMISAAWGLKLKMLVFDMCRGRVSPEHKHNGQKHNGQKGPTRAERRLACTT
jgi:hypothetical protein